MKKIIISGVIILVIFVIVLVIGLSNLGPIIKMAVNTYGPGIAKTDVSVKDVDVSILSAVVEIKDFYLGNPEGFKSEEALRVGSVFVDVDEKSLADDTIIIKKIEVVSPEISYEKKHGTDNFKTILNNMDMSENKDESAQKQKEKKENGKKIFIENFILKDGRVNFAVTKMAGKGVMVPLPDIHLKDIGNKTGNSSPEKVFREIFDQLYRNITSPKLTAAVNDQIKRLGKEVKSATDDVKKQFETVGDDAAKSVEDVKNKVKGLFGK